MSAGPTLFGTAHRGPRRGRKGGRKEREDYPTKNQDKRKKKRNDPPVRLGYPLRAYPATREKVKKKQRRGTEKKGKVPNTLVVSFTTSIWGGPRDLEEKKS